MVRTDSVPLSLTKYRTLLDQKANFLSFYTQYVSLITSFVIDKKTDNNFICNIISNN